MKLIFTLIILLFAAPLFAQIDTVVVRIDSTFESKFHRKVYDRRTNIKYHLEERASIRDLIVYLASLEELATGNKLYAVRIDQRLNRNLFTDAPVANAEYIDEDELSTFISYLQKITKEIIPTNFGTQRFTEYRFYTRGGIMLECYTGANRWRCVLYYELNSQPTYTYINNPDSLESLLQTFINIQKEIETLRKSQ